MANDKADYNRSEEGGVMKRKMEARVGIEPALTDLQSAASPLCHRAILERETGFEPATSTLARLRSTN